MSLEDFDLHAVRDQPLVSVVIPSRHRLPMLRRAIASVDAQSYKNIEIIVVDNNSDDPIKIDDFETNCRVLIKRVNNLMPVSYNRNVGVDVANGALVCFLDDDDTYMSNKISEQVAFLEGNAEIDYCYADVLHIGQGGRVIGRSIGEPDPVSFLRWRHIHPNALMVRKSIFEYQRFDESMTTFEDVDFAARLVIHHRGHHLPAIHAVWNRDNRLDQLTSRNWRRSYLNWKRLCFKFSGIIETERGLAFFYHAKMLLLSARFFDIKQFFRSLMVLVRCPFMSKQG